MKQLKFIGTLFILGSLGLTTGCSGSNTSVSSESTSSSSFIAPYIGENGNWYVDGKDSGVKAAGKDGKDGEDGKDFEASSLYQLYVDSHPAYKSSQADWLDDVLSGRIGESYNTHYNIIFTVATIPPVLGALDSITNGYETYAIIERGKTYYGIDNIENFHNVGFDKNNNTSSGLTEAQYKKMEEVVKELNVYGNEHFHFFVQDATALSVVGMAANAQLTNKQYEFNMLEDGQGAYDAFTSNYVTGKSISESNDEPYQQYVNDRTEAENIVSQYFSRTDNPYNSEYLGKRPWALASLPNFYYRMQSKANLMNCAAPITESKLYSALGFDSDSTDFKLSINYGSISEGVNNLDTSSKTDYLTLMYGDYYEGTYNTLTRTTLSDGSTPVPSKKLVFIPGRIKNTPAMVSNKTYGIGGFGTDVSETTFPSTYADLPSRFKTSLLFSTEQEFNVFLSSFTDAKFLENDTAYSGVSQTADTAIKNATKIAAFNYYCDYMFGLKLCYSLYGDNYDIIMKGHPSEVIGSWQQWTNHYVASNYRYDKMINDVVYDFHQSNSTGKFIGMVPYGTAAENLAYLGADISLCGYNSSTYSGYDTSVDVMYVLNFGDGAIDTNSNLSGRYALGNLVYHEGEETKVTKYWNTPGFYKTVASYYAEHSETTIADTYTTLFNNWLTGQGKDPTLYTVNDQGFIVEK